MDTQFIQQYAGIILLVMLWDVTWKALALWRAAHRDAKVWFAALLVINSVGIVPIIYLFATGGLPRRAPSKGKLTH